MATVDITLKTVKGVEAVGITHPISLLATPSVVIPAADLDDQDAATITDPDTDIANIATNRIFKLDHGMGTTVFASMGYDDAKDITTDPVVKLFGRNNARDNWRLLPNSLGALSATMTSAASDLDFDYTNDLVITGLAFTTAYAAQSWDTNGCAEFVFGVETAAAGGTNIAGALLIAWAF